MVITPQHLPAGELLKWKSWVRFGLTPLQFPVATLRVPRKDCSRAGLSECQEHNLNLEPRAMYCTKERE